ncbi:MAG: hypothetical protein AB7T19_17775 [Planctomycetota bacterium]
MRRLRATFLLRCVLLIAAVGVFAAVLLVGQSTGWALLILPFTVIVWFVGVEGGLIPLVLEHLAVRRAARTGRPVSSIWFVDQDEQEARNRQKFYDQTRDNPTVR